MNREKCTACSKDVQPYDGVFVQLETDYQLLCTKCYNDRIAEYLGVSFDNPSFDPVTLKDTDDISHTFHFRTRLLGDRVIIDAIEILDGNKQGYQFAVIGDVDEELFNLFKLLFERTKRALSKKHIEPDDITTHRITQQDTVRGYITSDINEGNYDPLVVIDGKEVSWDEFGRMLLTYEGFNFKLEIFDKTEEK